MKFKEVMWMVLANFIGVLIGGAITFGLLFLICIILEWLS